MIRRGTVESSIARSKLQNDGSRDKYDYEKNIDDGLYKSAKSVLSQTPIVDILIVHQRV